MDDELVEAIAPRVEIVEECTDCGGSGRSDNNPPSSETCVYCDEPGGSSRVLTEGEFLLIEKVDGEWPEWAWRLIQEERVSQRLDSLQFLDVLAGGDA